MGVSDRDWSKDGEPDAPDPSKLLSIVDGAVAMHEMYTSYVSAGFTDEQAMRILLTLLAKAPM